VAPASLGADAHADNESVAGVGDERGLSLEERLTSTPVKVDSIDELSKMSKEDKQKQGLGFVLNAEDSKDHWTN
jgi:hypothetical protein